MLSAGVGSSRGSGRGLASIQWISGVLIEDPDAFGIEPILADLERSTGQRVRGKLFDGEANSVCGVDKPLIPNGLSPRHPKPTRKQLRGCVVVERVHLKLPRARLRQSASGR